MLVLHVHALDEQGVIREHLDRGYVLAERAEPSIIAQGGFSKLTFVKAPIAAGLLKSLGNGDHRAGSAHGLSLRHLVRHFMLKRTASISEPQK